MTRWRSIATGLAWLAALAGSGWLLVWSSDVEWLRIDWSDPIGWLGRADLETATAALARMGCLMIVGWIVLSTAAYTVGRAAGFRPSSIDWLSIGPLRRAVDAIVAGSLMLSTLAPTVVLATAHEPPPAEAVPADPAYVPTPAGPGTDTIEPETPPPADTSPKATAATTVVVVAGDHMWGLARSRMEVELGRTPTDTEIAPYWMSVVAENRGRIRSGDPDLIHPGEEIVLPPLNSGT